MTPLCSRRKETASPTNIIETRRNKNVSKTEVFPNLFLFITAQASSVLRLGLITFRFGMILSSLRMVDNGCFPDIIECDDDDFKASIIMAKVLLEHTAKVFGSLPLTDCEALSNGLTNIKQTFLDNLPQSFSRRDYLAVAERLKIALKTAERYISKFCSTGRLKHSAHDSYEKT